MVRRLFPACLAAMVLCSGLAARAAEVDSQGADFFEKKIRPVLIQHCFQCHSQDSKELGGKLRLDTKAGLLAGGESGAAIVPGNPKQSLLLKALRYEGFEMPPKGQLSESVVADFAQWIKMGAPDPRKDDAPTTAGIDLEAGRKFWSFQPITNPQPPAVKHADWARSDIDRFVLAKLEDAGLQPASDADPRTLVRRLSIDLTGMPATAEQVDAFVAAYQQSGPQAVEQVVDELLASPRFGERWARHWLDIARYGESNGNVRNATFPHAWRYRDYVIQSFNEDKPFDQFVTEQIAGDLLPQQSPADRASNLVATGFLAIGSKPNANGNANFRMDLVADQIEVVTTSIMGLTVACARCHDHKYDPVPTADYYALAGIFDSSETLYGATGNTMGGAPPTELLVLDPNAKPEAKDPDAKDNDSASQGKGKGNKKQGKIARRTANLAKYPAGTPLAMGVRDLQSPRDCQINIKGEARQLGERVPRGFVQVCSLTTPPTVPAQSSGRLELAQWLTDAKHPLTSRVAVNRIWHHLFGTGIVSTPDNFGLHGERPTHPELLDYLATRFVAEGWSTKKMIRRIVLSRAYQMSSEFNESTFEKDPDNHLIWRHNRRRLDAESFRDSLLAVSGQLDLQPGEASLMANLGEVLIQDRLTPDKIQKPSNHRSIYLCIMRSGEPEELLVFDLADPSLIVGARNVTTVPAQALFLMNSTFVMEQSRHLAERLLAEKTSDGSELNDAQRVQLAYRRSLQREATSQEVDRAVNFLVTSESALSSQDSAALTARRVQAWASFCQSLFATNEFRYVD